MLKLVSNKYSFERIVLVLILGRGKVEFLRLPVFLPWSSGQRLYNFLLVASCFEGAPKIPDVGVRGLEPARCPDLLQGEARPPQEGEDILQA